MTTTMTSKRRSRPISLSAVIRGQLAALAKTRSESSSVELTRNAKGNTQIKVSVADEAVAAARERAEQIYDELCAKYPQKRSAE